MPISRRRFLLLALLATGLFLIGNQGFAADTTAPADPAGPKAIYIIRHAEKPDSDSNSDSDADSNPDPNLTPKGIERAKALVHVIPDHFCTPDFIFATAPSKHSNRPIETVTPLAKALNMPILDPYASADFANLAHDLLTDPKYSAKTILICWHHGKLPALAQALGARLPQIMEPPGLRSRLGPHLFQWQSRLPGPPPKSPPRRF